MTTQKREKLVLLGPCQVAERLGVSRRSIMGTFRNRPDFPRPYKLSEKRLAWSEAEIEDWIETRKERIY